VLQRSCSVLQRVAACCSVFEGIFAGDVYTRHSHLPPPFRLSPSLPLSVSLSLFLTHTCCAKGSTRVQCVAACCSVLQRAAVCCRVLQCVAACPSVLQRAPACYSVLPRVAVHREIHTAHSCSMFQCIAVCCTLF